MKRVLITFCFLLAAVSRADMESTTVLPEGIRSPKFIYGVSSGYADRFNSTGLLEGAADRYHIELTGAKLGRLSPDLNKFISGINQLSGNQNLGNKINFGTMEIGANPVVTYFAPTFSYGLTKNLSIGFGIPIVNFRNDVSISHNGPSNLNQIHALVGYSIPELENAFNMIGQSLQNPAATLSAAIETKGYKPLKSVEFQAVGDATISAVYQYLRNAKWSLALRPYIQIPTGRKDDPDDLGDTAIGGQPALGLYSVHEYFLNRQLILASSVGYQANIEDRVALRVPENSEDILPGPERKEELTRRTGNSVFLEGGVRSPITSEFEIAGYYNLTQKDPDRFSGSRGYNYAQLSQDTGALIHQIIGAIEFSTVGMYTRKQFSVPLMVGYNHHNTVFAVNAAREITHQIYLRMFF